MNFLTNNYWLLIAAGAAVFLFGNGTLSVPVIMDWIKKLMPSKVIPVIADDSSLESAVRHFIALREHCSHSPEAQKHLSELWRHLEPAAETPEGGAD